MIIQYLFMYYQILKINNKINDGSINMIAKNNLIYLILYHNNENGILIFCYSYFYGNLGFNWRNYLKHSKSQGWRYTYTNVIKRYDVYLPC